MQTQDPFRQDWLEFVQDNSSSTIFHHPAWMHLLQECYGYQPFIIGVGDDSHGYKAGIPMMEIRSPIGGRRWVSLPFSDHCIPLYDDSEALMELTDTIVSTAADKHVPMVNLRAAYPAHPAMQCHSENVIHRIQLEQNVESVWLRVHAMHRRNIRIARERGVRVIRGDTCKHLREFYHLHVLTRKSQGIPVQPWIFFEKLKSILFDQGLGYLLLAYKDDRCIASSVFLQWQKTLTYKYGASQINALHFRPNNLIMWTAIEWGCRNGFTMLDLGRSSQSNAGLREFKRHWGATESRLVYTYLGPGLSRTRANNIQGLLENGFLERLMHRVIQKSPSWVCRVAGELLYRHVG